MATKNRGSEGQNGARTGRASTKELDVVGDNGASGQGQQMVWGSIMSSPVAVREIIDLGDKLRKHKIRVKDIIRDADDDNQEFDEEEADRRILRLIDKLKHLEKVHTDLTEQLDACAA